MHIQAYLFKKSKLFPRRRFNEVNKNRLHNNSLYFHQNTFLLIIIIIKLVSLRSFCFCCYQCCFKVQRRKYPENLFSVVRILYKLASFSFSVIPRSRFIRQFNKYPALVQSANFKKIYYKFHCSLLTIFELIKFSISNFTVSGHLQL